MVRRLFWRIFAARAWDPDLVAAARTPLPKDADIHTKVAKGDAVKALAAIEAALFPEDN